jgi:hypothetical protein
MFHKQMLLAMASLASLIAVQSSAHQANATKFSLPHGTIGLSLTAPNASGDVAGVYLTGGKYFSHSYGFVRSADGTFTTIDVTKSFRHNTLAEAIDDDDDVVGQYEDKQNSGISHGFLRTPDGKLSSFDGPGAYDTLPFDVNARAGEMVGSYYTQDGNHGFIRTLDGKFTTIDYPGGEGGTYPLSVNALGQITGTYRDSALVRHGFLRQPDGSLQTIDPPNSVDTDNVVINDKGRISGIYQDGSTGTYYGFALDRGTFYTFDQYFSRLNAHGQAVGQIFRLAFRHKKFAAHPLNIPKGCSNLFLDGINDSGRISGSVQCRHGDWFGYLTTK